MRWMVYLDGEIDEEFNSRESAREYARWLRNHPACRDRVQYGHGGVVRVISAEAEKAEAEWRRECGELD